MHATSWSFFDHVPLAELTVYVEVVERKAREHYQRQEYDQAHELYLLMCEAMICRELKAAEEAENHSDSK